MKIWLIVLAFVIGCDGYNTIPPEQAAKEYATKLGMNLKGSPVCAEIDTDCDDYVTCTLAESIGDRTELHSMQCAALKVGIQCVRGYAVGCKLTVANGDTKK